MATILNDVRLTFGAMDLSLYSTKFELSCDSDEVDITTFRAGTPAASTAVANKLVQQGLRSATSKATVLLSAGSTATSVLPDDYFQSRNGVATPIIVSPADAAAGGDCYLGVTMPKSISRQYAPGAALQADVDMPLTGGLYRGKYLRGVSASAHDGVGTAVQLGALAAGQRLLAVLSILSVTGATPTMDVTLESDDNAGFTSAITVGTFTQVTTSPVAYTLTATGPLTDTYYRINYNISEIGDESYLFTAAVGIG